MSRFSTIILFILIPVLLFSQEKQEDRLIRLIDAKSAVLNEINGNKVRKVIGPARFLHNGALIICDSAIWDVQLNIIDAIGNVRIIQNQTTLTSDKIKYIADRNMAEVRGNLVEMVDKEGNRLRTHFLDYQTKDSLAMFYNGGSMVNKDGNTIESKNGFYFGKKGKFLFQSMVEMKTDSVILSADSLAYLANLDRAVFLSKTNAWQKDGFLQAKGGWYDKKNEFFHFTKDVYIKTKDNEIWADTINYVKSTGEAELFNNIQILDSAQSSLLFSDYAKFKQRPLKVFLKDRPSVASYSIENGVADTLFFRADTIKYYALYKCEVDSSELALSGKRYTQSKKDALVGMFKKTPPPTKSNDKLKPPGGNLNSVAPKKEIPAHKKETPVSKKKADKIKNSPSVVKDSTIIAKDTTALAKKETKSIIKDSLAVHLKDSATIAKVAHATAKDTSSIVKKAISLKDTLKIKPDSTSVRYIFANKNAKFYRTNLQGICDSLLFNSIDSLIRLFKDPVVWTDNKQISSDSMQVVISDKRIKKAEFSSSAFLVIQEDSTHFDQIKGADMVAYFDSGELSRFDAFGAVSVLFFFTEDSVITSMNEKSCKAMNAVFLDKQIKRIRYFETVQDNAYPTYNLEKEKQKLKGFRWMEWQRPKNRFDICDRIIKASQASYVNTISKPLFEQTKIYFGSQEPTPEAQKKELVTPK